MNEHYLRNVIEAALLAAGRPVQLAELIQLFDENARPTNEQLRVTIDALAAEYAERGIELKETAGGVRVQVRRELAAEVSRLWPERPARYSRALLETLALIAYRQPITRGEIEGVRGVAVNPNIIKTLLERNWVRVVGQRDVPGRPELLGTTKDFLDYFGLKSLDELPPLAELKAMGDINLQLDLQGEPGQPARNDGQPAPAAAAAADGAAPEGASFPEGASSPEGASLSEDASFAEGASFLDAVSSGDATAPSDATAQRTEASAEASAEADATAIVESDASAMASVEPPSDEALLEGTADSALDDEDDGDDGDELSAEGGDSRELVAAPRGNDD